MDKVLARLVPYNAQASAAPTSFDPPATLELAFAELEHTSGIQLGEKAGKAVALLKALGLTEHARRFSKLTSRRKGFAHPDAPFLAQLRIALARIDPLKVAKIASSFSVEEDAAGESRSDVDTSTAKNTIDQFHYPDPSPNPPLPHPLYSEEETTIDSDEALCTALTSTAAEEKSTSAAGEEISTVDEEMKVDEVTLSGEEAVALTLSGEEAVTPTLSGEEAATPTLPGEEAVTPTLSGEEAESTQGPTHPMHSTDTVADLVSKYENEPGGCQHHLRQHRGCYLCKGWKTPHG